MYVYCITNKINGKQYIGITNDYKRRWANHIAYQAPEREQVVHRAIKKYGKENFDFQILFSNLTVEEASAKEIELIENMRTRVPNGYNVAAGGMSSPTGIQKFGADNANACLTEQEAKYIKDHRYQPELLLYQQFKNKISYPAFRDIYQNKTYLNIPCTVEQYPNNLGFSCQFTNSNYSLDDIIKMREQYASNVFWRDAYEEYKDRDNLWSFWAVYSGRRYGLVMPEVFTPERAKFQSRIGRTGERNGRARLTAQDVKNMRKMKEQEGCSLKEIYDAFPQVTPTAIREALNYHTWKNI